ncbi:MAG: hypothetical protein GC204_18585 [Chloroflexi bacterium]|nr:hypothetical protein [Chloroflexota bacterium]
MSAFLVLFATATPAGAEEGYDKNLGIVTNPTTPHALGEVVSDPECFKIINKAPYTVYGSINTNFYVRADGIKTRHKSNFRLENMQEADFCTYGPFYEGHKIELVLRTLVPIFTCKTAINGDIVIYGRRKSDGGTDTFAACL